MISNYFCLKNTSEEKVLRVMTNIESSEPAAVDRLSGRFSKHGTNILAKTNYALCHLSILQRILENASKVAKPKPIFKKGRKIDTFKYRPIRILPSILR